MAAVGVRELKAKASEIVDRSSKGETFLITKRGRPVAVIMPFDGALEDLILAEAPVSFGFARRAVANLLLAARSRSRG